MRVQLVCPVNSKTVLTSPLSMRVDDLDIYFKGNSEGIMDQLLIEYPIKDNCEKPTLTIQGNRSSINIGGERDHFLRIVDTIQKIESILSLSGMKKIRYDEMMTNWIPENEEEKKEIPINNFKWSRSENDPVIEFPQWLLNFDISKFEKLAIPLSFCREGMISFHQKMYISAFNNFYFIIEGLYGEGETKKVEDALTSSKELVTYAGQILQVFERQRDFEERFRPLFEGMKVKISPEGLIVLLVKYRHRLHHFWIGKKEWYGHPFNQDDFRTISLMALVLARSILDVEIQKLRDLEQGKVFR